MTHPPQLKHIDPYKGVKRRHIFFGLLRIFREQYLHLRELLVSLMRLVNTGVEFLLMATAQVAVSIANYLSPLAIYHILRYRHSPLSYSFLASDRCFEQVPGARPRPRSAQALVLDHRVVRQLRQSDCRIHQLSLLRHALAGSRGGYPNAANIRA